MPTILLVDDEKSIRLTMAAFLKGAGYDVAFAASRADAQRLLLDLSPDVAVIDLLLGDDSGLDVASDVQKAGPNTQVILMTGEPDVTSAREAIRLGVFDYLAKPVSKQDLLDVVARAAKEKRRRDDYAALQAERQAYQDRLEQEVAERTRALSESEEKYRTLVNQAGEALFLHGMDGAIVDVNAVAATRYGYSREELLTLSAADIDPDYVQRENKGEFWDALVQGGNRTFEARHRRKDGSLIPVQVSLSLVRIQEDWHILALARDISAERQAAEELATARAMLDQAEEITRMGSFRWDLRDDSLVWSRNMYAIHGVPEDTPVETLNQAILDLVHEEDRERVQADIAKMVADHKVSPMAFRIVRPDGCLRYIETDGCFMLDETRTPSICVGVHHDVTERKAAQQALLESGERYRSLVEMIPCGVEEIDLDGRLLFVNSAHARILGYAPEELRGTHIWDHDPTPREAQRVQDYFRRICYEQPPPEPFESRNRRKDGTIIDVLVDWDYRRDAQGVLKGFVAVVTDITQRKAAAAALRDRERLFRNMFQKHDAVMLLIDPDSGHIVDANHAALNFYGYSREELAAMSIDDINCLTPQEVRAERQRAKSMETNVFMFQHRLRSGDIRTVYVHSTPISLQGQTVLFSIIHDITDAEAARVRLVAMEAQLRALVDACPDIIVMRDRAGRTIFYNSAFESICERLFRCPATNGMRTTDHLPESLREHWQNALAGVGKGRSHQEVFDWRFDDGDTRSYSLNLVPIREGDAITGTAEFTRDITEQRWTSDRLNQALRREALGRLCAGVSHEYNNILMGILGYAHQLQKQLKDGTVPHRFARNIEDLADRATTVSRKLLSFARAESGRRERCELDVIVRDVETLFANLIGESVVLRTCADSGGTVAVDRGQIEEAVLNLLLNARDAMPEGGTIELTACTVAADDELAARLGLRPAQRYGVITVTDAGHGMDSQTRARAGDPFFTTKDVGEGTGLGLPAARGIVESHGGVLEIQSEEGKGTTVRVYLPVVEDA